MASPRIFISLIGRSPSLHHTKLRRLIERYDIITIFGHTFPDGDCYGSQAGLREAIKATWPHKQVLALGSGWPTFFSLIAPMDQTADATIASSLAIVLDTADAPRIEDQRFQLARHIFKIDHHIAHVTYGHDSWIDTKRVAVSEMIAMFVHEEKLRISARGATALALGMITDTGRFMFGTIESTTFALMGRLLAWGADLPAIYRTLYRRSLDDLAFERFVYTHMETSPHGVIHCTFHQTDLAQLQCGATDATRRVNILANVRGYPIWAFFAQDDGQVRCEFRSSGPDVQQVATKHGGGGHRQASGTRISALEDIDTVIIDLETAIKEQQHVGN